MPWQLCQCQIAIYCGGVFFSLNAAPFLSILDSIIHKLEGRVMQRRMFLKAAGAAVGMQVIPLRGVAQEGRKLKLAAIGTGGQARGDLGQMADEEFVAFCDVNDHSLGWVREKYPAARIYKDFRKMLADVHGQIDAVTVVTPDHVHHAAVMEAMKYNKHVFCEKPLAHAVAEGRELMAVAAASRRRLGEKDGIPVVTGLAAFEVPPGLR